MFRNYLAAALRNIVRNKLYAAINIGGLAVGFAAALLIAVFVRDELSYDTWIPRHQDVYVLGTTITIPGAPPLNAPISNFEDAERLRLDFPEIESTARVWHQQHGMRRSDVEEIEPVVWVDPEVFAVLGLTLRAGDARTALVAPDTVVVTAEVARKYFGRADVVGETIELDRKTPLRITGILNELPSRSHLNIKIVASGVSHLEEQAKQRRGGLAMRTYVRLKPGTDAREVERRFPDFIDRHNTGAFGEGKLPPSVKKVSDLRAHWLQPVASIHLTAPYNSMSPLRGGSGAVKPMGNSALVGALAAVGGLILFVAAANFVNLMTARASRRAVEVGVRKATGGGWRHLLAQFIGEAAVAVVIALAFGTTLALAALPGFNAFLDSEIAIEPLRDASLPLLVAALGLGITILGGFYPAFILARWHPAAALKGGMPASQRSEWLRQSLVVGQFAILIGLIVATLVISRQTIFATKTNMRADMAQVLIADVPCTEPLRNTLSAIDGVRGVACAGGTMVGAGRGGEVTVGVLKDGRSVTLEVARVDVGLMEMFGIAPIAGRLFDAESPAMDRIVLNESAVREFGYASPEDAIGKRAVYPESLGPEIIGVVPDFPIRSLEGPIGAISFQRTKDYEFVAIKLHGDKIATARPLVEDHLRTLGLSKPATTYFYDSYVERIYRDLVRQGQAFTAFAGVAVFLAGLGLFGLAAFTAERRTKEIGIRKAMGASSADVLRLLLWQFTRPVLWANLLAWPVAYVVMKRWLERFAAHIDLEAWVFVSAGGAAAAIGVATVIGHALLVARAKPVAALRYE